MTGGQVLRLMSAAVAALLFFLAGSSMRGLESQAGNTVAESFYNAMGVFAYGMAALAIAVGLPLSAHGDGRTNSNLSPSGRTRPSLINQRAVPVLGWDPAIRKCPNCGKRVAEDRKAYCNHCGEALLTDADDG